MLIINKMLIFLILMLVGLLLVKVKILDDRTIRKLSTLVLYVANPALIINSSQSEQAIQGSDLLTAVLVTVIFYAVLIAVAAVLPKLMRVDRSLTSAYTMMTVFTNIGFMGIPLVSEIFGTSGLLYVSIFILIFNILIYTYGVMILQRGTNPNARETVFPAQVHQPGRHIQRYRRDALSAQDPAPGNPHRADGLPQQPDRAPRHDGDRRDAGKHRRPLVFY